MSSNFVPNTDAGDLEFEEFDIVSVSDWSSDEELPNDLEDDTPADYGSTTSANDAEESWASDAILRSSDDSDDEVVGPNSDVLHITIYYYRVNRGDRSQTRGLRSAASPELQPRADGAMPVLPFESRQAQLIDRDLWNHYSWPYVFCLRFAFFENRLFMSLAMAAQISSCLF